MTRALTLFGKAGLFRERSMHDVMRNQPHLFFLLLAPLLLAASGW